MNATSSLVPYYDDRGFDALVCDEKKGLFGIFDGMGTHEDARTASNTAADYFASIEDTNLHFEVLRHHLNVLKGKIAGLHLSTGTTATIVHVDRVGHLHFAHCGDSRLYIFRNIRVKQITADEGVENILYNYIGDYGLGICQLGFIDVKDWDRFMLCSDGVTGDRFPDIIPDLTVEDHLLYSETPEIAVNGLLQESTKHDDKSIIVVFKT